MKKSERLKLKELHSQADSLDSEIERLGERLKETQREIDEIEFGIKVGVVITYGGKSVKITHFDMWPVGRKYKKDGTLHLYETQCYDLKRIGEK